MDIIGVPGGRNHYYRLAQSIINGDIKNAAYFHWTASQVLHLYLGKERATAFLEQMRGQMDARTFAQDFEGVVYAKGTGDIDKKGDPHLSHLCFAPGTMVETADGPMAVEGLPAEGLIRTWDGSFSRYVNPGKRGDSELVEVRFSDGSSVFCTPSHRFLTNLGWHKACDCRGAICYSWKSWGSAWTLLSLMVRSTLGMGGTISTAVGRRNDFTSPCGNTIKGRCPPDFVSTIRMGTGEITGSTIWNACLRDNTWPFTCNHQSEKLWPPQPCNFLTYERRPSDGIEVRKAGNGTGSTANGWLPNDLLSTMSASIVGDLINPSASIAPNSVPAHVRRRIAGLAGLTIGSISASCAGTSSVGPDMHKTQPPIAVSLAARKVLDVVWAGKSPVFCPTVATGCFSLANGVIVSNSDAIGYVCHTLYPPGGAVISRQM